MVKLVAITPEAEDLIGYCARVSAPENQGKDASKLLAYCVKHGHWSVFEMANMVLEIETGRDVAPQILRHRSFSFQEFSQRYSKADTFVEREARRQDVKNRQNSIDDISEEDKEWFKKAQNIIWHNAYLFYEESLNKGIAKECARSLLPLNTKTRIYMNGTVRSWIHYINLRADAATQKEHREIAEAAKKIFCEQMPVIAKALGWISEETQS
jgi:thymidylate synthase (FAD)